MNKYSSKAVKTAATVGMSLAMVLSAVPAVGNATVAQAATVCTTKKSYKANDVYASKTITGAKVLADVKTEAANAIKGLDLTKTVTVGATEVEYYLGYKLDATSTPTKASDGVDVSSATSKVTYGYYATTGDSITGYPVIDADDPLKGSEVTIAVRDNANIGADINTYVTSVLGSAWSSNAALTGNVEITDASGNKTKAGAVKAVYSIDGTDVEDTNPVGNGSLDSAKSVVVKIVVTTAFEDYSNCAEVGTGLGITDRYTAKNVYNEIVSAFDKASLTFENVKPGDEVEFTKTNTASLGKVTILSKGAIPQLDIDFKAVLKELARYLDNTTDEGKAVERMLDMDTAMNDMFKANGNLAAAEKYDEDTEFKTTSAYATAADLLEDFNDFETYLTNLDTAKYDRVTDAKSVLEDLVNSYVAENDGDLLDTYLTSLDKFYEKFVDQYGDAGITKANVDAAIKQIKNGTTFTDLKGKEVTIEKSDYTTFKENSGVEEYMTKFEDMYDEIEAVKEAVAKTNEAYKDLIKNDTSVKDFLTNKDSDRKLTSGKEFSSIKSNLTVDEYKILKAYKEEVLDVVLTLETKEVGNSYVNKSAKSIYATTAQLNTVLNNIGNGTDLDKGVFTKLDKEKGEFNWDKLVAHMEKVESSLEALTTGIEKLDSISLTVNDRAAIIAADDAVYFLTGDGEDNLTSAQARTVKNADRKVTELMEAYRMKFGSLNAELNGWVDKGAGNWAYYENGNAVTKWVASGSDWYYVKGGVMLRNSWIASDAQGTKWYYVDDAGKMVSNTTVNGYTFNSYGVWVK